MPAKARRETPLHLLSLSGLSREMGRAHGAAAKAEETLAAPAFYGSFLDTLFQFQAAPRTRWLRRQGRRLVGEFIERGLEERIPYSDREGISGFAEGSGLPVDCLRRAHVMPDVYAYLLARQQGLLRALRLACPAVGCTAFATAGQRSRGTRLIHARTLDFPGGCAWYRHPAVLEYAPSGGQRYASVTSLGIETAGLTAMNEAGLALSLNMNYSSAVRLGATPIVSVGREVVRAARTLGEALALLGGFELGAGWSFLISSWREANAVVVEADGKGISVRGMRDGAVACTNHYLDPERRRNEYWITPGRRLDSEGRLERVNSLLAQAEGGLDWKRAAAILADSFDPHLGGERSFGSTIAQVHGLSAVIFEPESRRLFLATGNAPVAKGAFVEVELFAGPALRSEPVPIAASDGDGRRAYAAAYEAYFPGEDLARAQEELLKAVSSAPSDSLYRFMLGLVQLKRGSPAAARESFLAALKAKETKYREAQLNLFLARAYDLEGDREKARETYQRVADSPFVGKRARSGLRAPWTARSALRLLIDFTIGDAVEPF